jgi:DUF4097 and DUF4098 domain-containing protein YvlB
MSVALGKVRKRMKKLLLVLIGVLSTGTAFARSVDETLDAAADGHVTVSIVSGFIEVAGWDKNSVHVSGTVGEDAEEFIFERDGDDVLIKVKVPDRSWGRKNVDANFTISVPRRSSLDIGTVSSDIDVEGVEGEQELQSVSGDVTTEAFASDIQAETVSGDVKIDAKGNKVEGEWDLSTVSGDLTAIGLSGDIEAEVVSGDIDVAGGAFERAQMETVSGDINFSGTLRDSGKLGIESVNGDVDIEFLGPLSARFDVETFNGRIRNCFGPKPERTSKYAPGLELDFNEGGGKGRVSVSTLNGNVDICKK